MNKYLLNSKTGLPSFLNGCFLASKNLIRDFIALYSSYLYFLTILMLYLKPIRKN